MKTVKTLLNETWKTLQIKVHWGWLVAALVLLFTFLSIDSYAVKHWVFPEDTPPHLAARQISKRGDFYNMSFSLVALCALIGWIGKNKRAQLISLSMLLACASSGLISLGVRVLSGRPRPATQVADGLYGVHFREKRPGFWTFDYGYQSMPSGHTTTAVATAMPLVILAPAGGAIMTVAAIAVAWARFQLSRHWPSDLYVGALFGGIFGVAFGLGARRMLKK